ncbi:MAG: fumarylacetoacetate hydrolase family protein [Candidatus Kapabacteria bacterium]|jgi:2-keto-4-pentenoate hydratase/2-oxohepta-3-ene-1,7-dioic acid hydratase in catechol pathway|nr:fumarylacetoacetate hydrolase family protein [Candidatus Kapabacteria bacterium]
MVFYTFSEQQPSLAIGTMYCIGRNFAAHAREMGAEVPDGAPLVFLKPPSAYTPHTGLVTIPKFSNNLHHEVELVVIIGKDGDTITEQEARDYIIGYAVGVDLTLRDIQTIAKQKGEPWATAKSFRGSAPLSAVIPPHSIDDTNAELELYVNGELRQKGNTNQMERSVPALIAYISSVFGLRRGDCIFTGTPEGVAQIHSQSHVKAILNSHTVLEFTVE